MQIFGRDIITEINYSAGFTKVTQFVNSEKQHSWMDKQEPQGRLYCNHPHCSNNSNSQQLRKNAFQKCTNLKTDKNLPWPVRDREKDLAVTININSWMHICKITSSQCPITQNCNSFNTKFYSAHLTQYKHTTWDSCHLCTLHIKHYRWLPSPIQTFWTDSYTSLTIGRSSPASPLCAC